ncbi:MAG: lamin tail domain-containing protein [bacterium]
MRAAAAFAIAALCATWVASAGAATVPISEAKAINATGTALMAGQTVTVAGVVTVASGAYSAADLDVYIQDATAGINIYKKDAGYFGLELGDSVVVTGIISQVGARPSRGNTRLTVGAITDLTVAGRGTLPRPRTVTGAMLAADAAAPLETYEGLLVRVDGVTFLAADWPSADTDKDLAAADPTASVKLRIDKDTDIDGSAPPRQPSIVVGVVVQDDGTSPVLSGYGLWPRARATDFLAMGAGCGAAALEPSVIENTVESFDLAVSLTGNLADTITAFTIDLPLADGWAWTGGVSLAGPGLEGASYDVTPTGVAVSGAAISDDLATFGTVTFAGMRPPAALVASTVVVRTSVDGAEFEEIVRQPVLRSAYPAPNVVINEIFPSDAAGASDAFVELRNLGASTAYLGGFALTEARPVPYCGLEVRHVFGSGDTIPAGGYLVIAASADGFTARFGFAPTIVAPTAPLGRTSGDGATVGGAEVYEVVALWSDASLDNLVDFVEYRDGQTSGEDLCGQFGAATDGYPYLPPRGYALVGKDFDPCCPYQALSGTPTPGAANASSYLSPTIEAVTSRDQHVVEISFSEPMGADGLTTLSNFEVNGGAAFAVYPSTTRDKALLLVDSLPGGVSTLEIGGVVSWAGVEMRDTSVAFSRATAITDPVCAIQAYDAKGYSALNGKSVSLFGFITVPPGIFQPSYQSIYVQGLDGCGVNVFSYERSSPAPRLGDLVYLTGVVEEYVSSSAGSTTEIFMSAETALEIRSAGFPEPTAPVLATGEVGREENEGRLVATEGAIVSTSDYSFYIDDGSGGVQVYQNYTPVDFTRFRTGQYVRVKGVILQYDFTLPFLDGYELVPRYESDIEIVEDAFPSGATLEVTGGLFCPSCGDESIAVRFGAPALSSVALRVFDGAGRQVGTIYSGASTGEREFFWTGRDDEGKPLAAGLYICHLEAVEANTGRAITKSAPIVIGTRLK